MKTQHLAKLHSNRLILGNVLGKFVKYTEKAQGNQALIYLSMKALGDVVLQSLKLINRPKIHR